MSCSRVVVALAALSLALPALAQDAGDDWDVRRERDLMVADAIFDSGIGLGVRCQDGGFGVIIVGLPPMTSGIRRTLGVSFGDRDPSPQTWITTSNPRVALAERPAHFARRLREGGAMNLVVPDGAGPGRNLRYVVDLPPSRTAIDSVMAECRIPVDDPRDALLSGADATSLPPGIAWDRPPRAEFPSKAWDNRFASGMAVVSCVTQDDGELDDCIAESEHPMGVGFGRAAVRGARRASVKRSDGSEGPIGRGYIIFAVTFGTIEDAPGTGATRLSDQRDRAGN